MRYACIFLLVTLFGFAAATGSKMASATPGLSQDVPQSADSGQEMNSKSGNARAPQQRPIIKINGSCTAGSNNTAKRACQTVVRQAEFERIVSALQPDMSKRAQREFALQYAEDLALADKAAQMGIDKGPKFEEQMRMARIKILSQAMKKTVKERASRISENNVEDYYQNNIGRFEQAEIDRIYIPKVQERPTRSDTQGSVIDRQDNLHDSEKTPRDEAETLRSRALAGEDFGRLQAEAYRDSGIGSAVPATELSIRRISLPASHTSVMDMKPGEISQVFSDPNGLYIYRLRTKETLSLDQVRDEIKETLRSRSIEQEMSAILHAASPTIDETYFVQHSER